MRRKGNEGDAVDGGEGTVAAALQVISREYARLIREKSQWDEERKKLRQRISFLEGEKVGQDSLIQMLRAQVDSLKSRVKGATGLKRSADKTASKTATFAEFQERYRSLSNRSWMKNFSGRSSYKPILRKFIKDLGIDVTDREENRSSWSKTLKPKSGAGITASSKVGKKSNTITSAESSSIRERRSKTQVVSRKKYEKKIFKCGCFGSRGDDQASGEARSSQRSHTHIPLEAGETILHASKSYRQRTIASILSFFVTPYIRRG